MAARVVSPTIPSVRSSSLGSSRARVCAAQRLYQPSLRPGLVRAGAVIELESIEAFEQFIAQDGLTVIDFYTQWCGPCKLIAPRVEEMAQDIPEAKFGKLDLTNMAGAPAFTKERAVKALPTFHLYKGGEKVNQMTGNDPKGLRKLIVSALNQ